MAKLVTKFKYLKPGARQGRGGYAKYIAIRDGVEKIDDSKRFAPATWNQKQLIKKILRDFPDTRDMLEYEDYQQKQRVESASEFISRAIEDNAAAALNAKTYADYIATRPRAERFGSHGLFTDDGVQVNLAKVSQELNNYGGNVWTVIISLRREDAERLGFDNGSRWRDMLRTQTRRSLKTCASLWDTSSGSRRFTTRDIILMCISLRTPPWKVRDTSLSKVCKNCAPLLRKIFFPRIYCASMKSRRSIGTGCAQRAGMCWLKLFRR